jgi:hypothetical protein
MEPMHISSLSHLLVGFVGRQQTDAWQAALRGADLMAVFRKPAERV